MASKIKVLKSMRDYARIYIANEIIEVDLFEAFDLFRRFPDDFEPCNREARRALGIANGSIKPTRYERQIIEDEALLNLGEIIVF